MQQLMAAIQIPLDPGQRIFWPFLLTSLLVMAIWSGQKSIKDILSPSSLLDFKIMFLNILLKAFVFPAVLISSFEVSVVLLKTLRWLAPKFAGLEVEGFIESLLATLIAFIVNDCFRFLHHYLMHKLPLLKVAHRTHHSALVLTPFTLYRAHPIEALIAGFRNVLSVALSLALYSFLIQRPVTGLEILGVNLFGFLFNAILANLRHSPVPISFGPLEYLFISPRMHQIHHSNNPQHFGKNYGVALAIWDQLFGSFYRPTKEEMRSLSFGIHERLDEVAFEEATTLKGALVAGFFKKGLLSESSSLKSVVQQPSR